MLTAALIAAALLLEGGQTVSTMGRADPPAEARPANAPAGPEGDTRRVCRYERATGSNLQQRVCRDIPRGGFQDAQTREFMRTYQRIRTPDEGGGPGVPPG